MIAIREASKQTANAIERDLQGQPHLQSRGCIAYTAQLQRLLGLSSVHGALADPQVIYLRIGGRRETPPPREVQPSGAAPGQHYRRRAATRAMSAKDGKNDPQETTRTPELFPATSAERAQMRQRLADNFCRITELRDDLEEKTRNPKAEIKRLEKANAAIVEELRGKP